MTTKTAPAKKTAKGTRAPRPELSTTVKKRINVMRKAGQNMTAILKDVRSIDKGVTYYDVWKLLHA